MFARLRRLIFILAVTDVLGTQLGLLLADYARRVVPLGQSLGEPQTFLSLPIHLIVAAVYGLTFATMGVYDVRRDPRSVGEPLSLARASLVAVFVFGGVLYFTFRDVPRLLVVYFFLAQLALLATSRLLIGSGLRLMNRSGRPLSRVLLVGTGDVAARVAAEIRIHLGETALVLGCADDRPEPLPPGLKLLGKLEDVPALVQALAVDDVIVALPASQYLSVEKLVYDLL